MATWIPVKKLDASMGGATFPQTSASLVAWCHEESESIYNWQYAHEVIEGSLRLKARDASMERLSREPANRAVCSFASEPCDELLSALTAINVEIAKLGLDKPVDITPLIYGTE